MGSGIQRKRLRRRTILQGLCMGVVVSAGLLLWARLKLVTNTPRMVYADPNATGQAKPVDVLEKVPAPAKDKDADAMASQSAGQE